MLRLLVNCFLLAWFANFTLSQKCRKDGFNRDLDDCSKYYVCVNNQVLGSFNCPATLMFNDVNNVCDYPSQVDCKNSDKPTMTTNTGSTVSPSSSSSSSTMGTIPSMETTMQTISTSDQWEWHPPIGPTTTAEPMPSVPNDDYKVVCYYSNWAFYRPMDGKFIPEDVNTNLCTHLNYGFVVLNYESLTLQVHDSWSDVDNQFFKRFVGLKKLNPKLKTLVAIGGWNDSAGDKYSRLVNDPNARRRFIKSVLDFLAKYGFDGLDLDWEYPVCWQTDCEKGNKADKQSFAMLIKELRESFKPFGYMLTAAVSPSKKVIDMGYDVAAMATYLDYINVMNYDYHGSWDLFAQHHAPLYARPESEKIDPNDALFNVNFTINYWIEKGMPRNKIVVGMPLYGRSVKLVNPSDYKAPYYGLGAPMKGGGKAGTYTREPGFVSYYEVCDYFKTGGFKKYYDQHSGPYLSNSEEVVSYDDVNQLLRKTKFIKENQLGGGMIWVTDLDDFTGKCCGIKYVLLKAINQGLRGVQFFDPANIACP